MANETDTSRPPVAEEAATTWSNGNGTQTAPESDDLQSSQGPSTRRWLSGIAQALGLTEAQSLRGSLEEALRTDQSRENSFSDEERTMLLRLLKFGECRVEDVMVPRADIIALEEDETVSDLLRTFREAGVSRIPVFSDTLDDPRGMVHIKDLFEWMIETADATRQNGVAEPAGEPATQHEGGGEADSKTELQQPCVDLSGLDLSRSIAMTKIRRPVLYVPLSMPAMNLLIRMQSTRIHMALVIDEYGGTDGLVTIEDLIEQIVGDIEDEHDELEEANIKNDAKIGLVASARTPVEELERHLDMKLVSAAEDEEIDTLGGLVFSIVGRVPARGELVSHTSGLEFEVLDADARRVKTLKIHLPSTRADEAGRSSVGS